MGNIMKEDIRKMEKRLLGVKDLSEYIGISPQTIYNKMNRGVFPIPFKKVFGLLKWEKEEVDSYLDKLVLHKVHGDRENN